MVQEKQIVLERDEIGRIISRMAHEIVEKTLPPGELVLIGIRSRAVHLARRITRKVEEIANIAAPVGALDVSPYRDDRTGEPSAREVDAPDSSGRTCRSAFSEVLGAARGLRSVSPT